ncbi:MAG: hypothetical protein RLZ55_136, partial [Actinomycetota bacterium]
MSCDGQWKSVATTLLIATLLWLPGCMTQRVVHQATCGDVGPGIGVPTKAAIADEVNVLALSAGGPWGGFGIGFL